MSNLTAAAVVFSTALGLVASVAVAGESTTTLDFTNLPFPGGTILTTEFAADGIIFSDDDTGIDPNFPCPALPGQENIVHATGQLFNLFRIEFVTPDPVVEVTAVFRDHNLAVQVHELFELDADLQIVSSDSFNDMGMTLIEFPLELNNIGGIAGIAACEQPLGAQAFLSLTFVTDLDRVFGDGFESGDTDAWSATVPP
jgi:hypothetical protein